jgi:hypothetical protein
VNGPLCRYLLGKELGEAELGDVQNFARVSSREIRQEGADVGDEDVRRRCDDDHYGLYRPGAATARHAGRRTRPIVASGQFITCARFVDDEARDAGSADGQQADDDRECELQQDSILAFDTWSRSSASLASGWTTAWFRVSLMGIPECRAGLSPHPDRPKPH